MKIVALVCRILLGLMFFVFGLNNILHFMKMPPPSGDALTWIGIMGAHHWMSFVGVAGAGTGSDCVLLSELPTDPGDESRG